MLRKEMPETTRKAVREFFYNYGEESQREKDNLMKLSKLSGFKASTNAQLVPIRQLELFKEKSKFEADVALPAAEKLAKVTEIDRKLAELARN